ncbi:hypothetical protein TWF694_011106 [Orbilia ellipsospora]|uniref:NAD(P)-binding protein n=1 Tax=Orbilia ellipsospora TaxID=2528407 RepID=A0AAV9X968_9PEZI
MIVNTAQIRNAAISAGLSTLIGTLFHPLLLTAIAAFSLYAPEQYVTPVVELYRAWTSPEVRDIIEASFKLGLCFSLVAKINHFLSVGAENNWAKDSYEWSKEVVLITGASSGYGERITELLALRGIKVITLSRTPLNETLSSYRNVHWYKCDITDSVNVAATAAQIRKKHGDPTVIVNNAGKYDKGYILDRDVKDVQKTMDVNFNSHFTIIKEFLPALIKKNHGHIVTIASLGSYATVAGGSDYYGSKSALVSLHETLRLELRHVYKAEKVRTSLINPSWTETPMVAKEWESSLRKRGTPILKLDDVIIPIVDIILAGYSRGPVVIPEIYSFVTGVRGWPGWIHEALQNAVQV